MPVRDWRLEARRLLSENCERHLSNEEVRSGGRRARAACIECLAEHLELVHRVGLADARRGHDEALKPWQDPTRWEGVTCPHCAAPPGSECKGPGVVAGAHRRRKDVARGNAIAAGAHGPAGRVVCPVCGVAPGMDCVSTGGKARRRGDHPLFHRERAEEANRKET